MAQQSGETANGIKDIVSIVENSVLGDYEKMEKIADQYNGDSQTINNFMMDFSAVSEELNASIDGIVKAMGEMARTITDSAGGMQNISEKINDINLNAIENKKSADALKKIIDKFNL